MKSAQKVNQNSPEQVESAGESRTRQQHNRKLALRYAEAGIPIFPVANDKRPLVPAYQQLDVAINKVTRNEILAKRAEDGKSDPLHIGSTCNTAVIRRMWSAYPDAIPGICTGLNGLVVIDVDTGNGKDGLKKVADWLQSSGNKIPAACPRVRTRSGGEHIYFMNTHGLGNKEGALAALDCNVRGGAGFVVAPSAWCKGNKRYREDSRVKTFISAFAMNEIPDVPPFIVAAIEAKSNKERATETNPNEAKEVRANTNVLRANEWPNFDDITDPVLGYVDLDTLQRDPDFAAISSGNDLPSSGKSRDSSCSGIRLALGFALKRAHKDVTILDFAACVVAQEGAGDYVGDNMPTQGEYSNRSLARDWRKVESYNIVDGSAFGAVVELDDYLPQHVLDAREQKSVERDGVKKKTRKLTFVSAADAARTALDVADEPLIEGLLDRGGLSTLYGDSNVGKSFAAINAAYHIARGKDWNGHKTQQGLVVYLALEGGRRIAQRIRAIATAYEDDLQGLPLALVDASIDLRNRAGDAQAIIDAVKEAETHFGSKAQLIIVDTLSRAMGGGDENSAVDMMMAVTNADRIRKATGSHLMVVHHSGKDQSKGARGHSSLRAAVDTEIEVCADKHHKGFGKIAIRKQRDMEQIEDIGFRIAPVEIGQDAKGNAITSAVFEFREIHKAKTELAGVKLNGGQAEMLDAITAMADEQAKAEDVNRTSVQIAIGDVVARLNADRAAFAPEGGKARIVTPAYARKLRNQLITSNLIEDRGEARVGLKDQSVAFGSADDDTPD